jgi:hypothetical protein
LADSAFVSQTTVKFQRATQRYTPEDRTLSDVIALKFVCGLFSDVSTAEYVVSDHLMNDEFERVRTEEIVAYFEVLSLFLQCLKKMTNHSRDNYCFVMFKYILE